MPSDTQASLLVFIGTVFVGIALKIWLKSYKNTVKRSSKATIRHFHYSSLLKNRSLFENLIRRVLTDLPPSGSSIDPASVAV